MYKMTDTNTLLMMVLKKHFKECPEILDKALKVIKDYSNKLSSFDDYKRTLSLLLETLNDLPLNILHYFLTMVPLPKKANNEVIPLNEAMQNYEIPSPREIQLILSNHLEKLNKPTISVPVPVSLPSPVNDTKSNSHNYIDNSEMSDSMQQDFCEDNCKEDPDFVIPSKKSKLTKAKAKSKDRATRAEGKRYECKTLLDICAEYVINNQIKLEKYYKIKKQKVWNIVNRNLYEGKDLLKCYEVIKDLNKKTKWIRSIEDEDTLNEIINEEYKDSSEVFLKEQHLTCYLDKDPFVLSDNVQRAIDKLFNI